MVFGDCGIKASLFCSVFCLWAVFDVVGVGVATLYINFSVIEYYIYIYLMLAG